ncbi:hypothetical protein HPB47_008679 [Ixodes persulcatus]|uniref:Uncharacterized protein n=1 Tax=Ixodes persulcatus TaxID=34615 RepID=A0AC60P4M3_IXOPE|nr:hypothetical protein HPB47_008679 [Ixodes persulcatus]
MATLTYGALLLRSPTERVFRDHRDAFDVSEARFVGEYRLTKGAARWLCDELRGKLQRRREGPLVLTVENQVLLALRFYAAGGFQGTVASDENSAVHQCTVSHVLHEVTNAIIDHLGPSWRCIGMSKNRFRCLQRYRALHYDPDRACNIATACAILHNVCLYSTIPEPSPEPLVSEESDSEDSESDSSDSHTNTRSLRDRGLAVRKRKMSTAEIPEPQRTVAGIATLVAALTTRLPPLATEEVDLRHSERSDSPDLDPLGPADEPHAWLGRPTEGRPREVDPALLDFLKEHWGSEGRTERCRAALTSFPRPRLPFATVPELNPEMKALAKERSRRPEGGSEGPANVLARDQALREGQDAVAAAMGPLVGLLEIGLSEEL